MAWLFLLARLRRERRRNRRSTRARLRCKIHFVRIRKATSPRGAIRAARAISMARAIITASPLSGNRAIRTNRAIRIDKVIRLSQERNGPALTAKMPRQQLRLFGHNADKEPSGEAQDHKQ